MLNKILVLPVLISISLVSQASYDEEARSLQAVSERHIESNSYQEMLDEYNDLSNSLSQNSEQINQGIKDYYGEENLQPDFNRLKKVQNQLSTEDASQQKPSSQISLLMVFVSSSMPQESLIQYADQVSKSGGVMVVRGFINGSMTNTVKFIKSLSEEGTRAIIDPNVFRLFDIRQVPEVIVISNQNNCINGKCEQTPLHDRIRGNVSLEYALEKISKEGDFAKVEAKKFLTNLRKI
ncbi:type-F conjugative transfer system pilin assembly protein TrbC [Rickettsiales bacterium]|nr:type-F conjugative transfer system pilin assembly protein TrbC [Rickettsiales bacterium]